MYLNIDLLHLDFFLSSRRRHTRCALVTGVQTCALPISLINAFDFQPNEKLAHECTDQRSQQYIAMWDAGNFGRHFDDARQGARRLYDGNGCAAAERILARERHYEIQTLVIDPREGVGRIDRKSVV